MGWESFAHPSADYSKALPKKTNLLRLPRDSALLGGQIYVKEVTKMRMILALFVTLWALPLWAEGESRLTISGEGTVAVAPDMAIIALGVVHRAKAAPDAMSVVTQAAGQMLARLEGFGVEARDVQTSQLDMHPIWRRYQDSDNAKIEGFEASTQLTLRVRDLDQLGAIMAAVLEDGANRWSGLTFGLQNPRPVQDEARRRAVADAQDKAALYAQAAGVTLGRILSFNEAGQARPMPNMRMAAMEMDSAAVPVAAGESNYRAAVTIVYELLPLD